MGCSLTVLSTVLRSYRADEKVIILNGWLAVLGPFNCSLVYQTDGRVQGANELLCANGAPLRFKTVCLR